jgi:uncharacterized protein involved in cysteine biosynthesis
MAASPNSQIPNYADGFFFRRFLRSAQLVLHSFSFTWQSKELRLWALLPIPINIAIMVGYYSVAFSYFGLLQDLIQLEISPESSWHFLVSVWSILSGILLFILVAGGGIICTLVIGNIVCAPLFDILSEKTERKITSSQQQAPFSLKNFISAIFRELRFQLTLLLIYVVGLLILAVLALVPIIGQVLSPIFSWIWSWLVFSLEWHNISMARHNVPIRDRLNHIRANKTVHAGFGSVGWLLAFIPGTFPFLAVAATQSYLSMIVHHNAPSSFTDEQLNQLRTFGSTQNGPQVDPKGSLPATNSGPREHT